MPPPVSAHDERREHFRDLQRRSAKARSVASVERRIRELVDAAPPLTQEQRDRLALLLNRSSACPERPHTTLRVDDPERGAAA